MKLSLKITMAVTGAVLLALTMATAGFAVTASDSVTVSLDINNYVSITSPSDVTMSAIAGTGGSSTGSAAWTVATNNVLGYSLNVAASSSPAMSSGANTIADYTETVAATPETWSVAATAAEFGFSAEGAATPTLTWGTPSTGSGKYRGFTGTTGIQVATAATPTSGQATTVYFKAEVGSSKLQTSGTYTATITATATTL